MPDLAGDKFTDGVWDRFSGIVWVPHGERFETGFEIRPALAKVCVMGFARGGGCHAIIS